MMFTLTSTTARYDIGNDDFAESAEAIIQLLNKAGLNCSPTRTKKYININTQYGLLEIFPPNEEGYLLLLGLEYVIDNSDIDIDLLETELPEHLVIDDYFCDTSWY